MVLPNLASSNSKDRGSAIRGPKSLIWMTHFYLFSRHWPMSPTNFSFEKTENLSGVVGKLTTEVRYLTSKNCASELNEQPNPFLHSNIKMSHCVLKEKITDTDCDFGHLKLYCLMDMGVFLTGTIWTWESC
jgi:hypothetical protein